MKTCSHSCHQKDPENCCHCHVEQPARRPECRCCGDADPPGLSPEAPRPGWQPGERPSTSPWKPGESEEVRWRRFPGVLLEEVRRGSGPKGPAFGKRKNELLPYLVI